MKNLYTSGDDRLSCAPVARKFSLKLIVLCLLTFTGLHHSTAQTTYNFSSGATLSSTDGFYLTQALITVGGTSYKLTHLGNGNFSNLANGGNGNSACLKKDGSGGDFLKIERNDGQPFQFYGMWLNTSSMYSPPFYQPPYYNIKYYDENSAEITAETFTSSVQNETITVSKNLKVKYVYVTFNAILYFKLDDLVVGPAAASPATVTISSISQFTDASFIASANVTSDGGASVTEKGIVYGTSANPTTANNKTAVGSGTGSYTQPINSLSPNTTYYVRGYAINSAGTSYSTQVTITTAAAFTLAQVHYFNTSWVSTTAQPSPFSKYVEGWTIKGTVTSGTVSISRLTAATGLAAVYEGAGSARVLSNTSPEEITSVSVKTADNSIFKLKSFRFKYLTRTAGTSFGNINITGYQNGIPVPGATATVTGVSAATAASYGYTLFDVSSNIYFGAIDEFVITASNPSGAAKLQAVDIDVLDIASAVILPLKLTGFYGKMINRQSVLSWKTAQEEQLKDFDIEYSANGINYTRIGSIDAAGYSTVDRDYYFVHQSPAPGNNYYRLKMNDRDSKYSYSQVINLKMTSDETPSVTVFPNPVMTDHFYINTSTDVLLQQKYKIVNAEGKTIQTGTLSSHNYKVNLPKLDKGNYFVQLESGQTLRIVLQ